MIEESDHEIDAMAERVAEQILNERGPKTVRRDGREFEVKHDPELRALTIRLLDARSNHFTRIMANCDTRRYVVTRLPDPQGRQRPAPWSEPSLEAALDRACAELASLVNFGDETEVGERMKTFFINLAG